MAQLGDLEGRVVVELGCGAGHNLAHLVVRHGATGIGIDHDPRQISRANALYGREVGITLRCADAAAHLAEMDAASVDICLSIFGAFSFSPPQPLLAGVAHVLTPGGRLAITLRADDDHDTVIVLRRR